MKSFDGTWTKMTCDENGYPKLLETSSGFNVKYSHDAMGNILCKETSRGQVIKYIVVKK